MIGPMRQSDHVKAGLRWLVQHGRNPETGRRWTQSGLAKAAGMSRNHAGGILRGDQTGDGIATEVARAYAEAAGVSLEWLTQRAAFGEPPSSFEEPRRQTREGEREREQAIAAARVLAPDGARLEAAVAMLRVEPYHGTVAAELRRLRELLDVAGEAASLLA